MKKKFLPFSLFVSAAILFNVYAKAQQNVDPDLEENGARRQQLFFERLHEPILFPDAEYYKAIAFQISKMPKEGQGLQLQGFNSWQYVGGEGVRVNQGSTKFSGRVTNFELRGTDNNSMKIVTASGGLWRLGPGATPAAISMSDHLSSLWGGAYASDPADSSIGFLGTGEFGVHGGTGMFKTSDFGQTWTPVTMTPTPSSFSKILFTPGNNQIIHATTGEGYYRSDDGGTTWTRKFFFGPGSASDLVINHLNTSVLYLAYWAHGVYKSIDGGDSWTIFNNLPTTQVGRTALTIGNINPDIVYVNMTNSSNNTKGIYRTTDGGLSWVTCVFGNDLSGNPGSGEIHWGQGWYNNVIAVCPTDDSLVLAGGGGMWRATDGFTFKEVAAGHADQHAIVWNPNGTEVFIGNDGGVFYSSNAGFTFSTANLSKFNNLPVSQYYHFSIGKTNANVMGATAQDNGFHFKSHATAGAWNCNGGGDGSAVQIDPLDSNIIIYGNGIYGGALQSHRFISFDGGVIFNEVDDGIDTCGDWFPEVRISPVLNVYYTGCGRDMYYSNSFGNFWSPLNPGNPMPSDITDFTVSNDGTNDPTVYACMDQGATKLMVFDGVSQNWVNRSAGLPTNTYVRKVAVDILDGNIAYALAGGLPSNGAGNKVFKTTDRGQSWTNISGNLPNVALADLIAYPGNSNLLYLGTEAGSFKTTDGGATWVVWTNGMPPAAQITEMDYVDSIAINGRFYVGACTYGRGIWIREVSGDDVGIGENVRNNIFLAQNTANPGGGLTRITYANSYSSFVNLTITDITGKKVAVPVNEFVAKGMHEVNFDRSVLEEGIYFYTLTACGHTQSKKMMVLGKPQKH